jgi:hypothetical protein
VEAHEGATVRVYFASGAWRLSTHRKLDAFQSRWGDAETFGAAAHAAIAAAVETAPAFRSALRLPVAPTASVEIWDAFLRLLNPDYCYALLISNTAANRLVCAAPAVPTAMLLGVFDRQGNWAPPEVASSVPLQRPKRIPVAAPRVLFRALEEMDAAHLQGATVFAPSALPGAPLGTFKLLSPDYRYLAGVRGNTPDVLQRYAQIRMHKEFRGALEYLFPEKQPAFDAFEDAVFRFAKHLKAVYGERYIPPKRDAGWTPSTKTDAKKKTPERLPLDEYRIVRQFHKWHCEDRATNRISLDRLLETLNALEPDNLLRIVRGFEAREAGGVSDDGVVAA